MSSFSKRVGYAAAVLTGLWYLSRGPQWSFEREFNLLLFIAAAMVLFICRKMKSENWRFFLIGLLLGAAASIKPHAVIVGFAFIPTYRKSDGSREKTLNIWARVGWLFLGGSIFPLICFLWIWLNGALPVFIETYLNYVPLYNQLDYYLRIREGFFAWVDQAFYHFFNFYSTSILLAPAAIGAYFYLGRNDHTKKPLSLLLTLFVIFLVYLILPNKLFIYHWFPLEYITILLVSLCFAKEMKYKRFVYLFTILTLTVNLAYGVVFNLTVDPDYILSPGMPPLSEADKIGEYLKNEVKSGDTVQPVGFIGYVVHGMYLARVPLATPYIFTSTFDHHVSHPYIKKLRADFLSRLKKSPPRFIVYGLKELLSDQTQPYPAFEAFIDNNYVPVHGSEAFIIFRRK